MTTKLFFSKASAIDYIERNHADESMAATAISDRDDYESMDDIPEWSGECPAYEVGDERIGWFFEPSEEDERELTGQLGTIAVRLRAHEELKDNATFALADIEDENGLMRDIPVVYYKEGDTYTFFTPCDWQGELSKSSDEIEDTEWRVLDTEQDAVMLDGLPRILPWQSSNPRAEARAEIGRRIKQARNASGMTVRELAEKSGLSKNNISRIEQGRYNVTIDTLSTIAAALGTKLDIGLSKPDGE